MLQTLLEKLPATLKFKYDHEQFDKLLHKPALKAN